MTDDKDKPKKLNDDVIEIPVTTTKTLTRVHIVRKIDELERGITNAQAELATWEGYLKILDK